MQIISDNSLRRRLKRRILSRRHEYFAICAPGVEDVLEAELAALPQVEKVWTTSGGVGFAGPLDLVYLANTQLNTAHRILLRLEEFSASSFPMLYDHIGRIEWELWIRNQGTFRFRVSSKSSKLNMQQRLIDTCRAGVEQRLAGLGLKAHYDQASSLVFTLRLSKNKASLSLDTSGEHLHKRGYKPLTVKAPIRETLACAILLKSHFRRYDLIVDPFCGSGTFLIEGARIAKGLPPGHARKFGFHDAPFYRRRKLEDAQRNISDVAKTPVQFLGFDISHDAVQASTGNSKLAGVEDLVAVRRVNFNDLDLQGIGTGYQRKLMITNLPYGRRLSISGTDERDVIERLGTQLSGWSIAILSKRNLLGIQGLSRRVAKVLSGGDVVGIYNGGLLTHLHIFHVPQDD